MKNGPAPRKQCKKCPWRKDVDANDIPNGYCETKHAGLTSTIAEPGVFRPGTVVRSMACHETKPGKELHCVGWLVNQLGPGNNIPLRLLVSTGRVNANVVTVGPQHDSIEDQLPSKKKRRGR